MKTLLPLILLLVVAHAASAATPVHFDDPRLKAAVEEKLGKTDPNAADMLGLIVFYFNGRDDFCRLEGLQYAANLRTLHMMDNSIADISPLGGLRNLRKLNLCYNFLSEIHVLASLEGLTELCLHHNQISDISPLASLTNLTELRLNDNRIANIWPLASLTELAYLDLRDNSISNIAPLASLKSVQSLGLGGNQITDISALIGLPKLSGWLHLDGNPIADPSPLSELVGVSSLSVNRIGLRDTSCLAPLTGLVYLDVGNNRIRDVSAFANMAKIKSPVLQGNPLGAPVEGAATASRYQREHLELARRRLESVEFLGIGDDRRLPRNDIYFSDDLPASGWIEQAGSVVIEEGRVSLFMVVCSCTSGRLKKYLTVFTPGKAGRVWLCLDWSPSHSEPGRFLKCSASGGTALYLPERRFLDTVKYAYGYVRYPDEGPDDPEDPALTPVSPSEAGSFTEASEVGPEVEISNPYKRAVHLAGREKERIEFFGGAPDNRLPRMRICFPGHLKYEGPSGWLHRMGTVDLTGDGRRSLFIHCGSAGTREAEEYLAVLTPGKPGLTSLCMWFDGTDTDYGPDLHRGPNTRDPLYAPETAFLEAVKYAYDYISDEDILACADEPRFAAHLWGKDNGYLREGILRLRRYPGVPSRCGSDRKVRLEVDGVTYSRCGSALMAYDARADEHYILYHVRSTYNSPAVLERVDSWLLVGLWGEGLVAVDLRDNYLRTLLAERTSVGKIEVTDSEIILDDGVHVLDRSILDR